MDDFDQPMSGIQGETLKFVIFSSPDKRLFQLTPALFIGQISQSTASGL